MINLDNVTLIAVTSVKVEETLKALEYSCRGIKFGDVKLLTNVSIDTPDYIKCVSIDRISNIDEWSHFIIYKLGDFIDTEFAMLIHDDGFIINPECWRDEFLEYDYIGAPWPLPTDNFSYRDINNNLIRVGNSVSLRSKKLIDLPNKLGLEWKPFHGYYNEDGFICVNYRHIYLENGIKYADLDVAKYFSHETMIPELNGIVPFAFHNKQIARQILNTI